VELAQQKLENENGAVGQDPGVSDPGYSRTGGMGCSRARGARGGGGARYR